MFDIGFSEFFLIVVLGIIFLGPEKLPEVFKDVAKVVRKIKRMYNDATADIRKEIEIEEMKEDLQKYKETMDKVKKTTSVKKSVTNNRDMSNFF